MEWLTKKTEYKGLPLYLRIPNYKNIWEFNVKHLNLVQVSHEFDLVKDNGLPTTDYNNSLINFDGEAVNLFDESNMGIVFLVETYGGSRNYWFYTNDVEMAKKKFDELKFNHSEKKLSLDISNDSGWNFLKEYPIQLFNNV